jgi:translocation and assembly module TamA
VSFHLRLLACLLLACAASTAAWAQEAPQGEEEDAAPETAQRPRASARKPLTVTWQAPDVLKTLFVKYLPPPRPETGERRAGSLRPWMRDIRRRVPEIAASEGYFSATVEIEFEGERREHATVTVTPGPRTTVGEVEISFAGDLAGEGEERETRRRQLREAWTMKAGSPFRSGDWDTAKVRLEEALVQEDYAAGTLASSEAQVDADAAKATLKLSLDSGPRFTVGEVRIEGLSKYPEAVVRRSVFVQPGERYSATKLLDLQRAIQGGPWFSSVLVDVERDASRPDNVPVKVIVTERPTREAGLALGYGTDDGVRAEAAFRNRDLLDRGLDLQSSVRAAQNRQIGYVDVYLPSGVFNTPRLGGVAFQDSVGVLAEHSTIQKLALSRFAVAGYRHFKLDNWELRTGLTYQIERKFPEGADPNITRALAPVVAFTWRHVDDLFDPKKGGVLNVQFAAATKPLASSQDFFKAYAHYQYWIPVTANDQILLRTEIGSTFAKSREGIPEDFLFRAGGSRSNRGYPYQGLGPREGDAVVGGRYIATGTAELVHWLNDKWGAAVFADVGDAADTPKDWRVNTSYGAGARFRTPAGPFALDLAYAEREHRFRLSFSVTVAF